MKGISQTFKQSIINDDEYSLNYVWINVNRADIWSYNWSGKERYNILAQKK